MKINKRVHYSYLDSKKGTLNGYIDIDLLPDDEPTDRELKKYVLQKWKHLGYTGGDYNSIQFESVQ